MFVRNNNKPHFNNKTNKGNPREEKSKKERKRKNKKPWERYRRWKWKNKGRGQIKMDEINGADNCVLLANY